MSQPSASGEWQNPSPPGTADDQQTVEPQCSRRDKSRRRVTKDRCKRYSRSESSDEENSDSRSYSHSRSHSRERSHKRYYKKHRNRRSRSRSYGSYRPRHKSSRYKRSRTRSRSRRTRTRSRSRSDSRHQHSYSRSPSRSPSQQRSRSGSWSSSSGSERDSPSYTKRGYGPPHIKEVPKNQDYIRKVYSKRLEVPVQENTFKNDGSFLEMFKKMQEEKAATDNKKEETEDGLNVEGKKVAPVFGKRRGGRVLKTGLVRKPKNPEDEEEEPKDPWSIYMKEVKRYKEACCDDDSKTRPLVK